MSIGVISISTNQRRETPAAPTVTAADQGLSLNGTTVQLGQLYEEPPPAGGPAVISTGRHMPFVSGTGSIVFTEDQFTAEEFLKVFTPSSVSTLFDSTVVDVAFQEYIDVVSGATLRLQFDATTNAYTLGGEFQEIDTLAFTSRVAFDAFQVPTQATAIAHIGSSDGRPGYGQLKFEFTTPLLVPEPGVMEYDGSHLFFSPANNDRRSVMVGLLNGDDPPDAPGVPASFIGDDGSVYLGHPIAWFDFEFLGFTYKIPLYAL